MSKKINTEENAQTLKKFILKVENNAVKDVSSSRGYSSGGARGRADSEAVNAILMCVNSTKILGEDSK